MIRILFSFFPWQLYQLWWTVLGRNGIWWGLGQQGKWRFLLKCLTKYIWFTHISFLKNSIILVSSGVIPANSMSELKSAPNVVGVTSHDDIKLCRVKHWWTRCSISVTKAQWERKLIAGRRGVHEDWCSYHGEFETKSRWFPIKKLRFQGKLLESLHVAEQEEVWVTQLGITAGYFAEEKRKEMSLGPRIKIFLKWIKPSLQMVAA